MSIWRWAFGLFAGLLVLLSTSWFWLLHTNGGAVWVLGMATRATQQQLIVGNVDGDISGGLRVSELQWSSPTATVTIDEVSTTFDVDMLPPSVEVVHAHLRATSIDVGAADNRADASAPVSEILESLALPIPIKLSRIELQGIDLRPADGEQLQVERLVLRGSWHEQIDIAELTVELPQVRAGLQGTLQLHGQNEVDLKLWGEADRAEFNLSVSGRVARHEITLDAGYDEENLGLLTVQATGEGDLRSILIERLSVSGEHLTASGSVDVSWDDAFAVMAKFDVSALNVSKLTDTWPSTHELGGTFRLRADEDSVLISESRFFVKNSDAEVRLDASFDRHSQKIDGGLRWSNLHWPIDTPAPRFHSERADVVVSGWLDDWTVTGLVELATAMTPNGQFRLTGKGDLDQASLQVQEGRILGGDIAGSAQLSWRDNIPWSADLSVGSLRTQELLPQYPGVVSGEVTAVGSGRPFSIDAQLRQIDGEVLRRPLSASGHVAYSVAGLNTRDLMIRHGQSHVVLNGSYESAAGLAFELNAGALQNYSDMISGSVSANGVVSGNLAAPFVSLNLESPRIRVADLQLSDIRISDQRTDGRIADLVLAVARVEGYGSVIEDLAMQFSFAEMLQSLSVSGSSHGSDFAIGLEGRFDNWREPRTSLWKGEVNLLTLELGDEYTFHVQAPAPLRLQGESVDLQPLCLADQSGASLCADYNQSGAGDMRVGATLRDIPLAMSNFFVASGLTFEQSLSGSMEWSRDQRLRVDGKGDISVSPGLIASAAAPDISARTSAGHLSFEMRDSQLLAGALQIPMPGTGSIEGEFEISDVRNVADSNVAGRLNVLLQDVDLLAHFIPSIDSVQGRLAAELELSGSVSSPLLTGEVNVEDGEIFYRPVGLRLNDVQLHGRLTRERAIELSGRFRAGDGTGEIVSSADYSDASKPGLRFKLRGNDLLLVDVPDIRMTVQPDIELAVTDRSIEINGSVLVPFARIAPANLAESRVDESEDVVIVAGALPEKEEKRADESKRTFAGALEVTLGDQIDIDLDIAKAKVAGAAVFTWSGPPMPLATGRYDLTGSLEAYGQVLDIAEGGIRFLNGPADNPSVRLRAEREIYGNAQVKRAGVMVSGEARRPVIEAYTFPQTTEERALTLLVTGSDFDYEQGVGALDFGTYVGPRLFISYGVGIFDQENVISARYDLAKGFGLKATSGKQESGVDLNYRIEN